MTTSYQPITGEYGDKQALLKRFCAAPPDLRQQFIAIAKKQRFDRGALDRSRDEAFFGCCVADLRQRQKSDAEIKAFAADLLRLPSDELDFLVLVSTQMEHGAVSYVPGFTRHVERVLAEVANAEGR